MGGKMVCKEKRMILSIIIFAICLILNNAYAQNSAEEHLKAGMKYFVEKNYDNAINEYNTAIQLNPDFGLAYFFRGMACSENGDLDQAMSDFDKVIVHNPDITEAHYFRGYVYQKKGDFAQAIVDYNKAIQINPDFIEARDGLASVYGDMGLVCLKKNDFDKAIFNYSKAIEISPNHLKYMQSAGLIMTKSCL